MCPHCGRDAPIVYRGVVPYCTACGGVRAPLATASVNLAGKTSQVGATVATVAGWIVLLVGLSMGLGVALLLWALFSLGVALAVLLPIALVSAIIGVVLLRSGRNLRKAGTDAERLTHEQALLAMAAHHGPITAGDAARALGVPVDAADRMLTELAKREPERVAVDVDDQGVVRYRAAWPFSQNPPGGDPMAHVRVDPRYAEAGSGANPERADGDEREPAEGKEHELADGEDGEHERRQVRR